MGKVYRQDKKSVQRVRARDIVPGDIVEVAGQSHTRVPLIDRKFTACSREGSHWMLAPPTRPLSFVTFNLVYLLLIYHVLFWSLKSVTWSEPLWVVLAFGFTYMSGQSVYSSLIHYSFFFSCCFEKQLNERYMEWIAGYSDFTFCA